MMRNLKNHGIATAGIALIIVCCGNVRADNDARPAQIIQTDSSGSPFDQQAASIQALTASGKDLVYAGSFGHGIFRSQDRGATWTKSGQGVTDPFILCLTTTQDGTVYAGTFRGGGFCFRVRGKTWGGNNGGVQKDGGKVVAAFGGETYSRKE